ncbi:MAG: hypothetical protein WDZ29_02220 [Balneolaceae bacterium]
MKTLLKSTILALATLAMFASDVEAQVSVNADFMSRYVWRGADFGNSPSIQPSITYTAGNFEIGTWAAFATTGDPDGTEVDFFASYTFDSDAGSFSLSLTDYTFPDLVTESYFMSEEHYIEAGIGYGGTESFPISLFLGTFLTNDDDNSVYIEAGYDAGPVDLILGLTPSESALYGTAGAGVLNLGLSASREIVVTPTFSFDINSSVMANPYSENLFFVFGLGF